MENFPTSFSQHLAFNPLRFPFTDITPLDPFTALPDAFQSVSMDPSQSESTPGVYTESAFRDQAVYLPNAYVNHPVNTQTDVGPSEAVGIWQGTIDNFSPSLSLSMQNSAGDSPSPLTATHSLNPTNICSHAYRPLPYPDQHIIDSLLAHCQSSKTRTFNCLWPNCTAESLAKSKARAHVCKHLKVKLFECKCGTKFASQGSAKRHIVTQSKEFPCRHCLKKFARGDHRNVHQRRCSAKFGKSVNL